LLLGLVLWTNNGDVARFVASISEVPSAVGEFGRYFARYRLLESRIDIDWPPDHGSLFHPLMFELFKSVAPLQELSICTIDAPNSYRREKS
jgi:hypothetical protein